MGLKVSTPSTLGLSGDQSCPEAILEPYPEAILEPYPKLPHWYNSGVMGYQEILLSLRKFQGFYEPCVRDMW